MRLFLAVPLVVPTCSHYANDCILCAEEYIKVYVRIGERITAESLLTGVDQRKIMKHTDALFGKGNGVI